MLGYETEVVNGTKINVAPRAAFNPMIFGPAFTGAAWPRQGVFNAPPVIPSPASMMDMTDSTMQFGAGGAPAQSGNPFHLTKSPVIWVLVFIGISLFMLHKVHYKG